MVGWFQRKSSNRVFMTSPRTGVFYRKTKDDYVVLWQGREICCYESIEAFIDAHLEGLEALESIQHELLESYYRTLR